MTRINEANRIEDLMYGEFFNVMLHNGDNPAIELNVDFTGMPLKTLAKLAYDTMKVKFRPHVKGMSTEAFLKTFNHQTITWREMITKSGSASKIAIAEKSPEEIAGEIARLQASLRIMKESNIINDDDPADDGRFDKGIKHAESAETSNNINDENYVPEEN